MKTLRIQIVNYKTKTYLFECIESLIKDLEGSEISYVIAIIDNNSGDDLSSIPQKFLGTEIEIYQGEKNIGFGSGHNFLAKQGDARYLLMVNPDVKIIEPKTISRLLQHKEFLKADVLGSRLVTEGGMPQKWDHGDLFGMLPRIATYFGGSYWIERRQQIRVSWVCGAWFLINQAVFLGSGGFDENFFLYKEEEDLCLRIRQKGGFVFYDPTIAVFHHSGVVAKKSDHLRKSTEYFISKHSQNNFQASLRRVINKVFR